MEKTAATAGVAVRGDEGIAFNTISWTPERLNIVAAAMFETCGLNADELFGPKEDRWFKTAEWAIDHLLEMFSFKRGEKELEAALKMLDKALTKIHAR